MKAGLCWSAKRWRGKTQHSKAIPQRPCWAEPQIFHTKGQREEGVRDQRKRRERETETQRQTEKEEERKREREDRKRTW